MRVLYTVIQGLFSESVPGFKAGRLALIRAGFLARYSELGASSGDGGEKFLHFLGGKSEHWL